MAAKDNKVFEAAMQFCRQFNKTTPESVIYAYSRLLCMDEKLICSLVSDEHMDDIEEAHKWFDEKKLDMVLIKSGMLILVPLIPESLASDKQDEFIEFLEQEGNIPGSYDILNKALELAFIPFTDVFSQGNELQVVFNYQSEIKEKYAQERKKKPESNSEKQEDSENKPTEKTLEEPKEKDDQKVDFQKGGKSAESVRLGDLSKKYRDLSIALLDIVKGQDQAVVKFIQGYNQGELLKVTEKKNRPKTYFFFFGPPGVGKTLLAETAAESLGIPHKTFDMSEYASDESYEDLVGISDFYKNAKDGVLVKYVRENPECLLIFDEIEKANISAIRLFLQILGSGKLRSIFKGDDVSFRDATIIFTSNVGKELYEDRSVNLTTLPEKVLISAIQGEKTETGAPALPLEICSRIASGNTVMFNHLSVRHLAEMVRENFDRVVTGMETEHGVSIKYSNELPLLFLYNRGGGIDARVASGQSAKFLKDEIYELLRQLENKSIDGNCIKKVQFDIEWEGMEPELTRLFKNEDKAEILVFSDRAELFDMMDVDKYKIHRATTLDEAIKLLRNNINAVFIDPFYGTNDEDETVLSIVDYNTDGIKFFRYMEEKQAEIPVYLLEIDREFSSVDRRTFLQEGAAGTVLANSKQTASFGRQFNQIMEELYMEKESQTFSQRGWVIDFNTKQELTDHDDEIKIVFYNLKKRMAIDVENRGAILSDAERPKVRFGDVIGAEKAKEELEYFVNYLKNPKQFLLNGGRPPKGVLLYGPPGTGKTMLAKAMAGECDVTFLQTSASEFKNSYVGASEANIRKAFSRAKKYAPSIIFIDEIDAIGKKRTGQDTHTESMLNALLTEMDGFSSGDSSKPVFVLAATNYGAGEEKDGIAELDEALIRRFDNKIYVDLPKESERKQYILSLLSKKGIDTISEKTAQSIAERTTGKSLAILQNVLDLAQRMAVKNSRRVEDADLLNALEDYVYGEKKEHGPDYYKKVAIHEMGHAFLSYLSGDKPSYITIESRGDFGGYMQHANQEEVTQYSREDLLAKIRTALGGRAAEEVFFGKEYSLNTGASSDLQNATNTAWRIICTYGMDGDQLVVLSKDDILKSTMASDYVAKVNEILKAEMKNAIKIIEENKEKVQKLADALVKENRLTGPQFEELFNA